MQQIPEISTKQVKVDNFQGASEVFSVQGKAMTARWVLVALTAQLGKAWRDEGKGKERYEMWV